MTCYQMLASLAGARFRLMYRSQEAVVTWHGSHIKTELVIPAMGDEVR